MLNKTPAKPLSMLTSKIFSGAPLYSIAKLKESQEGVPILNIKDIIDTRICINRLPLLSLDGFKNAERYIVYPGDVLITCRGTQLKVAVVPDSIKRVLITANFIAIRLNTEQILPEFLSAYFNTKEGQKAILTNAIHTTMLLLNISTIGKIDVPVPSLSLQKKIINLANVANEHYHLSLEIADMHKMIANQVIANLLAAGKYA